jgi:LacI family transcriptional regulator
VSHVLNHPDRVADATRDKVLKAIADLGFSRNSVASALASGRARSIGLVVPTLRNSMFVDMAEGAQRAARAAGLMVQLANADTDPTQQDAHLDFLDGAQVAGLLLAPMQDSGLGIEQLRRHGRPVVVLNYDSQRRDVCTVLVDNEEAGYLATQHLLGLGRRRLAFVAGRYHFQPVHLRRRGVQRAVDEGTEIHLVDVAVDDLEAADGARIGRQLLRGPELPDAILAVTDTLAVGVIAELTAASVRVPDDVAVMGCDHNASAWGGPMPLSSVAMRGEELGREALRLLMEEIQTPETHEHQTLVLRPELVIRESTVGR